MRVMDTLLLTPKEAAALLGLTPDVLAALRRAGIGPRYGRLTPRSRPVYVVADLAMWAVAMGARGAGAITALWGVVRDGESDPDVLTSVAIAGSDGAVARFEATMIDAAGMSETQH